MRDNTAQYGGGIAGRHMASPVIENCVIDINESAYGGGIHVDDDALPEIRNCQISNNSATRGPYATGSGGGISCAGHSNAVITDCVVFDNDANRAGGGIRISGYASPYISGCNISGNTAYGYGYREWPDIGRGGGLFSSSAGSIMIKASRLINNKVDGLIGKGGGIYCTGTEFIMENCVVAQNQALVAYSGCGEGGGVYSESEKLVIMNCTIADNHTPSLGENECSKGGGIFISAEERPLFSPNIDMINTILWNNLPTSIVVLNEAMVKMTFSNIQGGWSFGENHTNQGHGDGNIETDPLFAGEGDYHLTEFSLCIDAGRPIIYNGYTTYYPETDLEGNQRPQEDEVDMGAYEFLEETE